MDFRFLHTADCHLGSPLRGLAARDPALARLFDRAVWRAFETMVETAIAENVAFVLIAGDVFDQDWKDYATGQAFIRAIARLPRAGIRVAMIRGNHDATSVITRSLPLPDGVVWLDADRPETLDWADLSVAVHGMSFKTAAVTDPIVDRYPPPLPGRFNIGMMHTALEGRPDVARYAPASLADLERLGYDYWALGHVHAREVVRAAAPAVVFPGNTQGRSIRECGEKSVTLVDVAGAAVTLRRVAVDHARFAMLAVDVTGATGEDAMLARVREAVVEAVDAADRRPLAVRIRLFGRTDLADSLMAGRERLREEIQAAVAAVSDAVAVEKVVTDVRADVERPLGLPGVDLGDVLDDVAKRADIRAGLAADTDTIGGRMPLAALDLMERDEDATVAAARAIILSRLGGEA